MPEIRETQWITNDPTGTSGGQSTGGAIAAGGIGGIVAGIKKFLGTEGDETREQQMARAENRRQQDEWTHNRIDARRKARMWEQNRGQREEMQKTLHNQSLIEVSSRPFALNIHWRATGDLSTDLRVHRSHMNYLDGIAGKDPRLFRAEWPGDREKIPFFVKGKNVLASKQSDFKWKDSNGAIHPYGLLNPADIDFGHGGEYKFYLQEDESLPYHQRLCMANYRREIAELYALNTQQAALAVIREYFDPGCEEGLGRFRSPGPQEAHKFFDTCDFTTQEIRRITIVDIMHHSVSFLQGPGDAVSRNLAATNGPDRLMAYVSKDINTRQKLQAGIVSYAAFNRLSSLPIGSTHTVGNCTLLDANGYPKNTMAQSSYLNKSIADIDASNRSALDFGPPSPRFLKLLDKWTREDTASSLDNFASDPSVLVNRDSQKEMEKSIIQIAKDWMKDDTWQRAGEAVSEIALGHKVTEETKKTWAVWDEVGQQISERIMAPAAKNNANMLRQAAQYYAICWAKSKGEAPPAACVDVFREHSWTATRNAVTTLIIGVMTKSAPKNTRQAVKLRAAWDSLGETLRDPRCIQSRLDREVDECVKELYNASNIFDEVM